MRRLGLLLLIALIPAQVWAFNVDTLQDTIAMPLAVAAVSDVAGVQPEGLADLVVALNQANVRPAQFVEVIRYVPVVFVDQNGRPFIQYVQEQSARGLTGDALVNVLTDRLRTRYDVTPTLALNEPATTYVVREDYIPATVVTRMTPVSYNTVSYNSDPLALIAMPLAVAAVSNISGVPQNELASLVATLNQALVPPTQVVEVLRYAPAALVVDNGEPFVQFVQLQTSRGIVGSSLVPVVVQELQTYYPSQTQITVAAPAPQRVLVARDFVERDFVPQPVVTRVEEFRAHPHGGPPGQLKKQLGLQTGAEVVHGSKPGRQFQPVPAQPVVVVREKGHGHQKHVAGPPPAVYSTPPAPKVKKEHGHGKGHAEAAPVFMPPPAAPTPVVVAAPQGGNPHGNGHGHEAGGPPGNPGKQKGNGGGKGHGKG